MKPKRRMKNSRLSKWDPSYYVKIYELSKQGLSFQGIADALGVTAMTLKAWREQDEGVAYAVRHGKDVARASKEPGAGATFLEYVYKRLPEDLKETWAQLDALNNEPNPEKRIEFLLQGKGKREMQVLFVHALIGSNFNAAEACRKLNISYSLVGKWKERDPEFLELMDTIHEMKKDFCEGALMDLVSSRDTSAVLFVNRTLNRDRGYDPKITVEHKGSVTHQMDIMSLGLPPEILKVIMEAMQNKRLATAERRIHVLPEYHDEEEFKE